MAAVYPENHRFGAVATVSECTDIYSLTTRYAFEALFFKYNFGFTMFSSPWFFAGTTSNSISVPDLLQMEATGRGIVENYHQTSLMKIRTDPSDVFRQIPDYFRTAYSNRWAHYFSGATDGAAKSASTPHHGQQLYDISNGVYGRDATLGLGSNNGLELIDLIQYEQEWCETFKAKRCVAMSYNGGFSQGYEIKKGYYLVGRNSSNDSDTRYGTSKQPGNAQLGLGSQDTSLEGFMNCGLSIRDVPLGATFTTAQTRMDEAIDNNGWYRHFVHWQNVGTPANFDGYLSALVTTISTDFVRRCGFGEAAAYLRVRDAFVSGELTDNTTTMTLQVTIALPTGLTDASLLIEPISIAIDLTGTSFDGSDIAASGTGFVGIREKSANNFAIDIDFSDGVLTKTITLTETVSPDYYDFTVPTVTVTNPSGNVIRVVTDIPTRVALFSTAAAAAIYATGTRLINRSNTLATQHDFDLDDPAVRNYVQTTVSAATLLAGDIYAGAISEVGQSNLSTGL
jgi:hypothetical protein